MSQKDEPPTSSSVKSRRVGLRGDLEYANIDMSSEAGHTVLVRFWCVSLYTISAFFWQIRKFRECNWHTLQMQLAHTPKRMTCVAQQDRLDWG